MSFPSHLAVLMINVSYIVTFIVYQTQVRTSAVARERVYYEATLL